MRTPALLCSFCALTACTETASVDVLAIRPQPGQFFEADIMITGHVDGDERLLKLKLDGQYVMFEPYFPDPDNPELDGIERASSKGGLGFAVPPDDYVIELEHDDLGIVLRTAPIALEAGSNHLVFFGEMSQLAYVAHHDASDSAPDTMPARVTNTLGSREPIDIVLCPVDSAPPAPECDVVESGLAHGETWEAEIPTGLAVHARPPGPASYTGADDFTFRFTPDHWYNGTPEQETPCTRCSRGSLYPFGWTETDCGDPWSPAGFCLSSFETHDNRVQSFDGPSPCESP